MSKSTELTTTLKQETMLQALKISCGAVSKAAAMTQITPQTHYNWYKNDEEYRDRVDNIKYEFFEEMKDIVMEALLKKLKEGNTSVINRSFQTFFGKWAEQMDRANPYRPRLTARIKYVDKPGDGSNQ
jgi:hypothetical protein